MLYLFINLAEYKGGVTQKTADTIVKKKIDKKRFGREKLELEFMEPLIINPTDNKFLPLDRTTNQLSGFYWLYFQKAATDASKIYLCAHGHPDDVDNIYVSSYKDQTTNITGGKIGNVLDLAKFLDKLLIDKKRQYKLSLTVCYGARSSKYLKDHSSYMKLKDDAIKSSFAFKLYRLLCTKFTDISMSAGIGAMSYDISGQRHVTGEDDVRKYQPAMKKMQSTYVKRFESKINNLINNPQKKGDFESLSKLYETHFGGQLNYEEYLENLAFYDKNITSLTPDEKILIKEYVKEYKHKMNMLEAGQRDTKQPKYGIVKYKRMGNNIIVEFTKRKFFKIR